VGTRTQQGTQLRKCWWSGQGWNRTDQHHKSLQGGSSSGSSSGSISSSIIAITISSISRISKQQQQQSQQLF
jgi:hypothetical protein